MCFRWGGEGGNLRMVRGEIGDPHAMDGYAEHGWGLARFRTVHRNLGRDGPSASTCGLCGSALVDFLSPKAAPVGDKSKTPHFQSIGKKRISTNRK